MSQVKSAKTIARIVLRKHNAAVRSGLFGGYLLFAADGSGGSFFTNQARPQAGQGSFKFEVKNELLTLADVEGILAAL